MKYSLFKVIILNKRFITPDLSDKRALFAAAYLEAKGFERVEKEDNADFILLGVNPSKALLSSSLPVFAGNISGGNVFDYTKKEEFALENAFLTAEGALSLAISESDISLINSKILIIGYGRIGKALHRYLSAFTGSITVCLRSSVSSVLSKCQCAQTIEIEELKEANDFDFIFNTVPHPVMGSKELCNIKKEALIIELASFPGGIDKHVAKHLGLKLIEARGLPSRYSPESAGIIVGKTVEKMIREVII